MSQVISIQEAIETDINTSFFNPGNYMAAAFSNSSANINWDAYQGANLISKTEFFRLMREKELLKEAIAIDERNAHVLYSLGNWSL